MVYTIAADWISKPLLYDTISSCHCRYLIPCYPYPLTLTNILIATFLLLSLHTTSILIHPLDLCIGRSVNQSPTNNCVPNSLKDAEIRFYTLEDVRRHGRYPILLRLPIIKHVNQAKAALTSSNKVASHRNDLKTKRFRVVVPICFIQDAPVVSNDES